jgi:hypothetical protein
MAAAVRSLVSRALLDRRRRGRSGAGAVAGCFSVYMDARRERFAVPMERANHPLFWRLLNDAECKFGRATQGAAPSHCPAAMSVRSSTSCGRRKRSATARVMRRTARRSWTQWSCHHHRRCAAWSGEAAAMAVAWPWPPEGTGRWRRRRGLVLVSGYEKVLLRSEDNL